MKTNREKVQEMYKDKSLWVLTPPSRNWIAKKLGISKGLVQRYLKELGV